MKVCYIRYSDPMPFRPDGRQGIQADEFRAVFRTAGMLIREDDEYLFLGERAVLDDNIRLAERYGADMFPAYRNVIPVRKIDIMDRIDFEVPD